LNKELFIARKIYSTKDGEKKVSPPAVRIAMLSIALGLAVMIIAVCIIVGFKKEVQNKVIGFGSHIQISNFDSNTSYEVHPIAVDQELIDNIQQTPGIAHINYFATKPGIIKTDSDFQGIILKGVDENFNWDFFRQNLKEGDVLEIDPEETTTRVIISRYLADKLQLSLNESFNTYFIQEEIRARKFHIAGIYETNFAEYDKLFIISDIKQVRRLNKWDEDQIGAIEILIDDYDRLDEITENLYYRLSAEKDRLGNSFFVRSVKQLNPMIFEWLALLDMNVVIILILMLAVSGFSMISGLLIIILERANMIGILKALGETNANIRKIFLYVSFFLISKGLFWGNIIGLGICFFQKYTGFLKLDPATYYVAEVPIRLDWVHLVLLNAGTLLITMFILVGPSYIIARISPVKSIRFE